MNLNLVQILGRITKKPELRASQSGTKIVTLGIATNRTWKNENGEKKEEVDFHNATAFGRTAEVIVQYLEQGQLVYVQGRLHTSSWEAKDGSKRYRTDIIVEKMEIGPKAANKVNKEVSPEEQTEAPIETSQEISAEDVPF